MTKHYHLTQEQALELAKIIEKQTEDLCVYEHGLITFYSPDGLKAIINAALDKVLGEPVGEVVGEGNNFAYVLNKRLPKDTKLYAPKELT
jgi:hypothetical protein